MPQEGLCLLCDKNFSSCPESGLFWGCFDDVVDIIPGGPGVGVLRLNKLFLAFRGTVELFRGVVTKFRMGNAIIELRDLVRTGIQLVVFGGPLGVVLLF